MAITHVLRLRRTDDPSNRHLLLNVTQSNKNKPLDLKLIATEHEHLYHGAIKSSNLASLQASNYKGDDDEWQGILIVALTQKRPERASSDILQGLEVVAAIDKDRCTITIRRNIGGVTQRLGSIKLDQDDEREEVSAFDWVETAVAASDGLRSQLETLQTSLDAQQSEVAKLSQQLDELVKAKKDHEDELLQKFAALLNSKKSKIRDQQRLLQSGQINGTDAAAHDAPRGGSGKRKAGPSSRGKRKANGLSREEEDEMDLDPEAADEDLDDDFVRLEEEEGLATPEQETTEDDASDDGGFAPPALPSRSKPPASQGGKGKAAAKGSKASIMQVDQPEELPPRRELPFGKPSASKGKQGPPPAPADDDDETDDEL